MPTENRSSNTEQMVSARVCAYTPGQSRVELQLIPPGALPSWLELGQQVIAQPATQHQGEPERDARDYAIEHAGFLADAADQVLADYKAYSVAQMLKSEGGDDGDGELEDAVDAARDDLREGLANLRGMAYEFRKRRVRSDSSANAEPAPTSDGFSAGDMADQGAKAFAARDGEVEELRAQLAEGLKLAERVRDSSLGMQRKCLSDLLTHLLCASSSEDPSEPVESDQGIPGTSFQRLNMLANQGE
ncbi:hypothetical protein D3C77_356120 [compost metagenome]